jgi:tellurite resistance protein TerC
LHALHENNTPFINDGHPVSVTQISTGTSLLVILGVLVATVATSLLSDRGRAQNQAAIFRRDAVSYLEVEADPTYRRQLYDRLVEEEARLRALPDRLRRHLRADDELMALVVRVRAAPGSDPQAAAER